MRSPIGRGAWAAVRASETFNGPQAQYPASAINTRLGRGLPIGPAGEVTIQKDGPHLMMVFGYITNPGAGTRAEVFLLINGGTALSARLYVSNAGGADEKSAHRVMGLKKGDKLTMLRQHGDGANARQVDGELFVQEI